MKPFLYAFVLLFTVSHLNAQLGIAEKNYLNKLEDKDEVSILVKGDLEKIQAICLDLKVNFKYGYKNIAALSIAKNKLNSFYTLLDDATIEIPLAKASLLMDTALIHNRILPVHDGLSPLMQAYKGKDVIIGILDSGIYFEHEDFKNADGTTRIKYIWDQNITNPTNSPAPYAYGDEWSWIDIDNGSCNHVEPASQFGHGTTVAGAACGNGLATGTNTGVAPECDIIAVAVDYYGSDFLSNTVDAIDYVFKKADALGKPCVINTSFGTYSGSHDGKDFTSQLIDALIEERSGRALVASAGNGNNINDFNASFIPAHLSYPLSADTNFTWFRTVSSTNQVYFDLWADTADFKNASFAISNDDASNYTSKGASSFMTTTSFIGNLQDGIYKSEFLFDNSNVNQGQLELYLEETEGRYHLEVLISPTNIQDFWRFSTTGSGTFDIWSSVNFHGTSNMISQGLPPNFVLPAIDFYQLPDNKKSLVSSWQCSDKVITVGNFANRGFYYDVDSVYRSTNLTPGEIYHESSEGPTRDNRLKPDISATGNLIFASGNAAFIASALNVNRPKVAPGAKHNSNGGTSMSSPVVAGAVALYLEENPTAWWYEIKEALNQTALKDSYTGPTSNTVYGHGKLNAFALMQFDAVLGCMDSTSFNYNPLANVEDGSCTPIVFGCIDSSAINFDASANTDDGSCIPTVLGCMDSTALNYDSLANVDDGSCSYFTDTTSIRQVIENNSFTIAPNPALDYFIVDLAKDPALENYQIVIKDLLGATILEEKLKTSSTRISVEDLPSGVYWINLQRNNKNLAVKKLVVE